MNRFHPLEIYSAPFHKFFPLMTASFSPYLHLRKPHGGLVLCSVSFLWYDKKQSLHYYKFLLKQSTSILISRGLSLIAERIDSLFIGQNGWFLIPGSNFWS